MKKKIALEGPINKCTDAEAKDWREQAKAALGDLFEFHDPMAFDCRGREKEMGPALRKFDRAGMASCHYALMNAEKPGWGTARALEFLCSMHIPVFAVFSGDNPSPWLDDAPAGVRIFKTFDEAIAHLRTIS